MKHDYKCHKCGVSGVKLWRQYQGKAYPLMCVKDAEIWEKDGRESDWQSSFAKGTGDQIGWMVPAVPVKGEPGAFWGYTSVPDEDVNWWLDLPTLRG